MTEEEFYWLRCMLARMGDGPPSEELLRFLKESQKGRKSAMPSVASPNPNDMPAPNRMYEPNPPGYSRGEYRSASDPHPGLDAIIQVETTVPLEKRIAMLAAFVKRHERLQATRSQRAEQERRRRAKKKKTEEAEG